MPHHVFIVEDHTLMRDMISEFIEALPDLHVCGTCRTGEEALGHLPADARFVLVDIALPGMSGISLIDEITTRWPHLDCLACSAHQEASYIRDALRAGAKGYVAKGDPAELVAAIECLKAGGPYLSASLREEVEAAPDRDAPRESASATEEGAISDCDPLPLDIGDRDV